MADQVLPERVHFINLAPHSCQITVIETVTAAGRCRPPAFLQR